jgi:hypothetical protein
MTDRRRRAASPRHYEISRSVIHRADQRLLDTVCPQPVDRDTVARTARSPQGT